MLSRWQVPQTFALLLLVGCGFSSHAASQQPPIDAAGNPPSDSASNTLDGPGGPPADWWNTSWGHRHPITIDMRKVPTNLAGSPLAGFPVLVKLTPQTFDYAAANSDGSDLRFVLPDQTVLPYDIDTFTTSGTSFIWVRMPTLTSGMMHQLFVYHGNSAVPPVASGASVFADTNVSVHHLGADYSDATGHAHTGTPSGNPSAISTGQLGGARHFNGTSDYITLPTEGDYDFLAMPRFTVSAWIRVTAFDIAFQAIVTKGDTSWRLQRDNNNNGLDFGTTSGAMNDNEVGNITVNDGKWHHAAIVYDSLRKFLYVDGSQDAAKNYTLQLDQNQQPVDIGRNSQSTTGGDRLWHGDIDEVRISNTARAPAWIRAEYVTATDASFVTVGADQSY